MSEMRVFVAVAPFFFLASNAQAFDWRTLEWRVGAAYASGLGDVTDLHEDNLRGEGLEAEVDLKVPLGIAGGVTYDWPSGARIDLTVGPTFFIGGDVSYFEVPLGLTGGYSFARDADVNPYVRGGIIYHFASGDYEAGSTPGLLVAAGVDFTRLTIEIAADNSEVEFETVECTSPGICTGGRKELNTYEVIASVYWRFR
jgi:opacity protein-like surface antigen